MIKKIRRKRIVIWQKEVFLVKNGNDTTQICEVCRKSFSSQTIAPKVVKQLPSAETTDKNNCS